MQSEIFFNATNCSCGIISIITRIDGFPLPLLASSPIKIWSFSEKWPCPFYSSSWVLKIAVEVFTCYLFFLLALFGDIESFTCILHLVYIIFIKISHILYCFWQLPYLLVYIHIYVVLVGAIAMEYYL